MRGRSEQESERRLFLGGGQGRRWWQTSTRPRDRWTFGLGWRRESQRRPPEEGGLSRAGSDSTTSLAGWSDHLNVLHTGILHNILYCCDSTYVMATNLLLIFSLDFLLLLCLLPEHSVIIPRIHYINILKHVAFRANLVHVDLIG